MREVVRRKCRPATVIGDIAIIPLTRGFEAIIDATDLPLLNGNWLWHLDQGKNDRSQYAERRARGKHIRMHHLILPPKPPFVIDHIDGNALLHCGEFDKLEEAQASYDRALRAAFPEFGRPNKNKKATDP